jgi:hypothetical protein
MTLAGLDLDEAWAQAAAILSRSYLDAGLEVLLRCRNPRELARRVFPESAVDLPDKLLVAWFQAAMARRREAEVAQLTGFPPGEAARQLEALAAERGEAGLARLRSREESAIQSGWVLRLRFCFGWDSGRTAARLAGRRLAAAARAALALPAGEPPAWKGWRHAGLLGAGGVPWPDPVDYERNLAAWQREAWWHHFHANPRSAGAVYAWCRLKEIELYLASSVAEGLLLGLSPEAMAGLLGRSA